MPSFSVGPQGYSFDTGSGGGNFLGDLFQSNAQIGIAERNAQNQMAMLLKQLEFQKYVADLENAIGQGRLGLDTKLGEGNLANQGRQIDLTELLGRLGNQQQQFGTEAGLYGQELQSGVSNRKTDADFLSSILGLNTQRDLGRAGIERDIYGVDKQSQMGALQGLLSMLGAQEQGYSSRYGANQALQGVLGSAGIGADASRDVAGINAQANRDVANINTQPGLMRESRITNNANSVVPLYTGALSRIFGMPAPSYKPMPTGPQRGLTPPPKPPVAQAQTRPLPMGGNPAYTPTGGGLGQALGLFNALSPQRPNTSMAPVQGSLPALTPPPRPKAPTPWERPPTAEDPMEKLKKMAMTAGRVPTARVY